MLYLDSNVFIYPVLHRGPKSDAAAALLTRIEAGKEHAATCALAFDEIAWVVGKEAGREVALRHVDLVLDLPNLRVLPVRETEMRQAFALMRKHRKLSPRDAVHAAAAIGAGIFTVVSDDGDLDTVPELDRRPLV